MTRSITTTWATEAASVPATSTPVSCVMVKTKTRSKKSSSVDTRTLRSREADTRASSPSYRGAAGQNGGAPVAHLSGG